MEPNKFATIIHGKTNRISLVLVYAFLEWTLIFLLLLNSLFSYLILRFARCFGLKPPCLLCSRLDHIFEPHNSEPSFCEQHSVELSKSGYCFSHRKLVVSQDMCVDCSSSHSDLSSTDKQLMCSCCGVTIRSKNLPTHFVIEPNSGVLGDTQKGNLVSRDGLLGDFDLDGSSRDFQMGNSDQGFLFTLSEGGFSLVEAEEEERSLVLDAKRETLLMGSKSNAAITGAYENDIILPQHLEFYIDNDDYGLIPVELLNLDQEKGSQVWRETDDELVFEPDMAVLPAGVVDGKQNLNSSCLDILKLDDLPSKEAKETLEMEDDVFVVRLDETKIETLATIQGLEEELKGGVAGTVKPDEAEIEDLVIEEEEIKEEVDSDVELDGNKVEKFPNIQGQEEETKREIYLEAAADQEPCVPLINSDDHVREVNELDVKVPSRESGVVCHKESNGVGINNDKVHSIESSTTTSVVCDASTSTSGLLENGHHGSKMTNTEEGDNDKENELNEVEEDRTPDTPTSIHSFQLLHRRLLLIGRSKTPNEESLDGSVVNDAEYSDGGVSMEELKSELRAERKAFHALYEELEEERNAAAIAASQTMAMINRLQEEKAAIEMEALQYQRMMEEQAEYDQEALQLMNEILVKREKEKEELERELEACMSKSMEYEERERFNQGKDITSSVPCSNEEEIDGMPFFFNNDSKENGLHHPADAILNMDSLSCFEEERMSILEQLKVLEENLCTLAEEEEHQIRSLNPFEQLYQDNAEELSRSFRTNGDANGEHHQEKTKPRQVLPQLNAGALGSDNELFDEVGGRLDPFLLDGLPLTELGSEKRRFTIEEEVERLYERLQALEEDKEFIKHCLGSLRKGDRGIDLLQEILQHLRDLKSVEFRARNVDGVC